MLSLAQPGNAETFGQLHSVRRATNRASNAFGYVEDVHNTYVRLKNWYNNKTRWSVTVDSKDRLYDAVLRWFLADETDAAPPRAVKAVLSGSRRYRFEDDDYARPSEVEVYYDERGHREINVAGHKVTVSIIKPDVSAGADSGGGGYRSIEPDRIYFHARSREGQQAILGLLRDIASSQNNRKPALHLMSTWGDWTRRDDLPQRSLESVVLARGQMERLRDDLSHFLDTEEDYTRRGIPYHRGYLLHGPPGTGKTSIVRALAAHFELDLWYAPLGDLTKDTSLISLINQVRAGSILLLEDIDVFQAARERDAEGNGLSMAGLLNALDGVATPHGLITFMTTNDRSVIDDAVIRPGRIDVQEEIGFPDKNQIADLFDVWYQTKLDLTERNSINFTGTTAAVTELFKRYMNDEGRALVALQTNEQPAEERSVTVPTKEIRYDREPGREARRRRTQPLIN